MEWSYRVDGIGDIDLHKESQNTLTYFCHCVTHLNNKLFLTSAYTEVVCLWTTAAFLVVVVIISDVVSVLSASVAVDSVVLMLAVLWQV